MRFTYPWLLAATPPLTALLWLVLAWSRRRRERLRREFTGGGGRPWADPGFIRGRQTWETVLTLLTFALLLVTLSGPRVYRPAEKSEMQGLPYLIALDASRSMQVPDIRPNRWSVMTNAVDTFLQKQAGDRIGLISFAGRAYLNAPLTFDTIALRTTLRYLSPDAFMDEQGSDFGDVVSRAGRYFETNNIQTRVLVVISDGEQFEGELMPEVYRWARKGLKLVTVGVGTTTGGRVPLPMSIGGGEARNSSGQVVISRLSEINLKRMANASNGRYYRMERGNGVLDRIRAEVLQPMAEQVARENMQNYSPWYPLPLSLALAAWVARLLLAADRTRASAARRTPKPAPVTA